jgi:hypothetical protein
MPIQRMLRRPRLNNTTGVSIDNTLDETPLFGFPRDDTRVIARGEC